MHYFSYKKGKLHAEGVPLTHLAEKYGTPLYVYSLKTIKRHIRAYQDAFKGVSHLLCYAVKANSNLAILKVVAEMGGGADVVSGGELYRALRAGIPAKRIVYAGVGKTDEEIRMGVNRGILMFNVESEQELHRISQIATEMGKTARVSLRVNPDIDPETHPYIATGLRKHKFGIPIDEALQLYRVAMTLPGIEITGVHKHIGSQITSVRPFVDALERVLVLIDELKKEDINIRYLDIGGGLGIQYEDENPPHPRELARGLNRLLKSRDLTLVLEPGRSVVGNAGVLLTRVLYTKPGMDREFIIVDAAMNDLMRPTLYNAYHRIIPVEKKRRRKVIADVVGPICESGDFLARDREMPECRRGELLAVMGAGAYGFSMSSNYNSRPRAAEVLVSGERDFLIRRRETFRDLVRGEMVPDIISEGGEV